MAVCHERAVGELFRDGDSACARGDVVALATVAEHLVEHVREPLHCELAPLAAACADPCRATAAWVELKQRLQEPS